jgi:hypothetical protein
MNYQDQHNPFTSGEIDNRPDEMHRCVWCDEKNIEPLMTFHEPTIAWVCNDCFEDFINDLKKYENGTT